MSAQKGRPDTPRVAPESALILASRRQMTRDGLAIAAYAFPVGLVYGLATLQAHFTVLDVLVASVVVLAGGAQFIAAGMVRDGQPWIAILAVTALVNARHLLYSAAIAPYAVRRPLKERALMAHFLTDETFALSLAHFRRVGRFDARAYWIAALVIVIPWPLGSVAGFLAAGSVDTQRLGLDIAFPAAMAGLSMGMVTGRRDIAAVAGAVVTSLAVGMTAGPSVGLVAGAALGPVFGLMVRPSEHDESSEPERPEPAAGAGLP